MPTSWQYGLEGKRDLRIDWLRGLAMSLVIVNHSRLSSLLSWFSYERFWVVTAAEVFMVLSGVVLGTVYGRKLIRGGWASIVRGLGRRALTLYLAFVAVTLSVLILDRAGVDVGSIVTPADNHGAGWFLDSHDLSVVAWRNVALMRGGPWAFQIVGLYVWLVAAAVPCLIALRVAGWRPLLAVSWSLYLGYRLAPHPLAATQFESVFPVLAWQLLFVHGLAIGYHRDQVAAYITRAPKALPLAVAAATAVFALFAMCNPWADGPGWLHWRIVSPERFTAWYFEYFTLTDLRIGRLLNLAVALPVAYALLTRCWALARPLGAVFVTLGQRSLAAFVLHVYGILLLAHSPLGRLDSVWTNTVAQLFLILAIAALLHAAQRLRIRRGTPVLTAPARRLAA